LVLSLVMTMATGAVPSSRVPWKKAGPAGTALGRREDQDLAGGRPTPCRACPGLDDPGPAGGVDAAPTGDGLGRDQGLPLGVAGHYRPAVQGDHGSLPPPAARLTACVDAVPPGCRTRPRCPMMGGQGSGACLAESVAEEPWFPRARTRDMAGQESPSRRARRPARSPSVYPLRSATSRSRPPASISHQLGAGAEPAAVQRRGGPADPGPPRRAGSRAGTEVHVGPGALGVECLVHGAAARWGP